MIFSPQEYRNKLIDLILSVVFFVIVPLVVMASVWFSSLAMEARQLVVFGLAAALVYAYVHTLRFDISKFKDVSVRKRRVIQLNAAVDKLFAELSSDAVEASIEFVNDTSVGIIKRNGYYEIDMHQNGVVEYMLKPDGLRSTQGLSILPEEVDRLIGEIELEVQHLSRRKHLVPLRAGL